jgi:hypothetical protein
MENKIEEQFLSLFEFLGRPAGLEGKQVYEAAKKIGIKCKHRSVANSKFTGNVMTYPKTFLEGYFKQPSDKDLFKEDLNPDLPF